MNNEQILAVFNNFRSGTAHIPITECLLIKKGVIAKVGFDGYLCYNGNPFAVKDGIYVAKKSAVVETEYDIKDFPKKQPAGELVREFFLNRGDFGSVVEHAVLFADRKDNSRGLGSLRWQLAENTLTSTATDGKRLYQKTVTLSATGKSVQVVIPVLGGSVRVLKGILGACPYAPGFQVCVHEKMTIFREGNFELGILNQDPSLYPSVKEVVSKQITCDVYLLRDLGGVVGYLKQFVEKGYDVERGISFLEGVAILGKGKTPMQIKKISTKPEVIVPQTFDPLLITLSMTSEDKKTLFRYDVAYLQDVVKVMGNSVVLYYDKDSHYGVFTKTAPSWW